MKKSIIKIGCFLVILVLILNYCNSVFKVKYGDGIYGVTKFYELDNNTVDVLILGSSHAFEDFNTGTLWDEYGMSSYILAGSVQPMWNTYYYLKEALKMQRPKLIVLEGYCTVFSSEFIDDSRIIKNNYGLHWSPDKVESLKISSPKERWSDFFLEYTQYHTRYKELSREDFLDNQGNPLYYDWKGFGCNMETTPLECVDISGVTERTNLFEKTEKYYRATIKLAKENNIPIVTVISPYAGITIEDQQILNSAGDIAEELGVPYLNCNLIANEIGIDYSKDAADDGHLNYRGNLKFSKYIGQYLSDNYNLPDHRGDSRYNTWERQARFISQMIYDQELVETIDPNSLCNKIKNEKYWTFISLDGTCNASDPAIGGLLSTIGITDEDAAGIWLFDGNNQIWYTGMGNNDYYRRTQPHDFHLKRSDNGDGTFSNSIIIDNVGYSKVTNGVNIVVYDTMTEKIVDTFGFDADNDYNLVR